MATLTREVDDEVLALLGRYCRERFPTIAPPGAPDDAAVWAVVKYWFGSEVPAWIAQKVYENDTTVVAAEEARQARRDAAKAQAKAKIDGIAATAPADPAGEV